MIYMDFGGGVMGLLQMIFIAYNFGKMHLLKLITLDTINYTPCASQLPGISLEAPFLWTASVWTALFYGTE